MTTHSNTPTHSVKATITKSKIWDICFSPSRSKEWVTSLDNDVLASGGVKTLSDAKNSVYIIFTKLKEELCYLFLEGCNRCTKII